MKIFIRIIAALALLSVLVAVAILGFDFFTTRQKFPPQTFIGSIAVSGLNQNEASDKLKALPLSLVFCPLITLEVEDKTYSFPPEDLGVRLLPKESVKNAFALTHQGNYLDEIKARLAKGEFYLPLILEIDKTRFMSLLDAITPQIQSSAESATFSLNEDTGGYHIEKETLGRELDKEGSYQSFKEQLATGKKSLALKISYTYPKIREKELRASPPVYRLSAYTTYYGSHDSPNRIHNIRLVASWINNTLLLSGESFSVAKILGNVTEEKGFRRAFVIVGGELVPLLGGGSCQIATTLYNAISLADLNVIERRNHSLYFNIYPLGRDAGVYPGQLDFKFVNDSGYPIFIKTVATSKLLSFRIYGTPSGRKVEFSGAKILGRDRSGKYIPMSLRSVIALDVPFKTFITRTVYDKAGQEIKKETIYSYYKLYGDRSNVPIRSPEPR
ncbi:hypothetical protein COT42_00630 [Candidatus Saganbacteria bacterium CG08_land_8_20_14_0_20_45_16]|uniref:YoaR-like putative peptidoglycan binding domain-containing protein n=1 Tax=Candidatus Saganbacteria bacterium CG08_land_8_20_14_0_20_45_16 TaxID=2014293 RepID=A0A2H0Y1P1_UNCSA|nr:MAG: hypothetical protein COT42_00630 [Candidatus Saganbacteria bacterium CG08_land_8_20_14_0_20_45_16]